MGKENKKIPRMLNENKKEFKREKKKEKKKSPLRTFFKVVGIILVVLLIIAAGVVAGGYYYITQKLNMMESIDLDESKLGISEEAQKNLSGYRNIAIFGIDSREDEYGEGYRSDCMIIASLNNKTKEIKLVSIYRDTLLKMNGNYGLGGFDKATHAYSYGEETLAINMLNTNLDLNITEFVTVNFQSVADTIDALGGITLNIEKNEIGYMNEYISATSEIVGKKSKKITSPGVQQVDGVQAVAYSRIRYTAGGEHKRTERMRVVLEAMLDKVKTKNIAELNNLADQLLPKIRISNTLKDDLFSFIPDLSKMTISESIGWPFETVDDKINGIYYGIPTNLGNNVIRLHQELFNNEEYILPQSISDLSEALSKKTGYR